MNMPIYGNGDLVKRIASLRLRIGDSDHLDMELLNEIYQLQLKHNPVYGDWVKSLKRDYISIDGLDQLTFLPISFFKSHRVMVSGLNIETDFHSSGSGGERSIHYIDSVQDYHARADYCFKRAFGELNNHRHIFFLPFYRENPKSSLLSMTDSFLLKTKMNNSRYIDNLDNLFEIIDGSVATTILWTVTYGAMDILELGRNINHSDLLIIETGGSKGQRNVLPRKQLHELLDALGSGVKASSEYGMCELFSQCYYWDGRFHPPAGFKVFVKEVDDPFTDVEFGKRGRICIVDLANVHSCSFIETEDSGVVYEDGSFVVEGRLSNSDLRGCNLMYRN